MPDIFSLFSGYADYFPLIAFVGLLLAGLNLPVSEDLIIITGALVCHEKPQLMVPTLLAIFTGVILTDFFVYWVGTRVRKGTAKNKFFSRLIPEKALDKMHYYLDKYGILTFIVVRFIPFGVRNTLFFAAGFFKLRLRFFIINDVLGAIISINTLFFLTYRFGEVIKKPIEIAGAILFILFAAGIISLAIRFFIVWRNEKKEKALKETRPETEANDITNDKIADEKAS